MAEKRIGLGRGLGALIPTAPPAGVDADQSGPSAGTVQVSPGSTVPDADAQRQRGGGPRDGQELAVVPGMTFAALPVTAIAPNPRQPRLVFDDEALAELAHSIGEIGLLQPVVVRPLGGGRYELVAGERRWRAVQSLGEEVIPALIRDTADDAMLRDALLENLHRAALNPLEEAAAYQQLLEDFGCTQEELATRIGRSRPAVSNTLRLLRLPPAVQRRVAAGVLSAGHARALLGVADPVAVDALAGRIVAEGLSVRSVEEIVALGEADGRVRTSVPRPRRSADPGHDEVASRLADRLDTRVRVEAGRGKGRIVVDFATPEDLARIVQLIDPTG